MLYFRTSELKSQDLNEAEAFVSGKLSDKTALHNFLITHNRWIESLKQNYPKEYEALEEKRVQGSEAPDANYKQLQDEFNGGLLRLTDEALST